MLGLRVRRIQHLGFKYWVQAVGFRAEVRLKILFLLVLMACRDLS